MRVKVTCLEGTEDAVREMFVEQFLLKDPDAIPIEKVAVTKQAGHILLDLDLDQRQERKFRKTLFIFRYSRKGFVEFMKSQMGFQMIMGKMPAKLATYSGRLLGSIRIEEVK